MNETYIPLIKKTHWVDLSNEHRRLREIVENDLKNGCNNGNIQPIMLQGAFGIGKSTMLYYLFHYGWEVLKTPTFYMPLAKIVDVVRNESQKYPSGKVENNELSSIISKMISSQLDALKDVSWDELTDVDFPEFKGRDESKKLTMSEYLEDFQPVTFESENVSNPEIGKLIFSEKVIREGLNSGKIPILLIDEFESKFYELKRYVESSGGGVLRELFDQIVQSRPFLLIIGNGPASGYEVAKEKGNDGNNDSETAANRRLKTMQIPFPTANLLKKKFMKGSPNGYVNFIWWMSRCRPGHVKKLKDAIDYETFKEKDFIDFINERIFKEQIDESGEEVKYLKTKYFNDLNSYIRPILGNLLIDFEPQLINVEDSYKDAMKDSAENFFCTDKDGLLSIEKELNPALSDDFSKYLKSKQENGKFSEVDYLAHLAKYFNYILSACSDKDGNIAFGTACRNNKEKALATTFLIPLLELTYDFVSQYEDNDKIDIKETKDFILECIKHIEHSVDTESIDDDFENLNSLFETCKMKGGTELYMQFSLHAIREFIEQPIGSPKLNYKGMSLEKRLESCNLENAYLLTGGNPDNKIIFVPVLSEKQLEGYCFRLKNYISALKGELHKNASKTIRVVYLQKNAKLDTLKDELSLDSQGKLMPAAKLKKLVFVDYNDYQFNFGGPIADFLDSVAKIVIVGCSCGEILSAEEDRTIDINFAINIIKNREWTKQKEVIRTIEHYSRLVCEGDTSVVKTISHSQLTEYNNALSELICAQDDYEDNIFWNFPGAVDVTVTDSLSKYLGLYYILENAKKKSEINPTLIKVLRMVGNQSHKLYFSPLEDSLNTSLHFDQILKVLSNDEAVKILTSYDDKEMISQHIAKFVDMMRTENVTSKVLNLLHFMKNELDSHWISSYNQKLAYGFNKGKLFLTLKYLKGYIDNMDFASIRKELNDKIAEKETELQNIKTKVSQSIDGIKDLLYSKTYQKSNPENMPFQGYISNLQSVSHLIVLCKQILEEETNSVSVSVIISSIMWRIAKITANASAVYNQISGILVFLNQKKEIIENKYQIPINTIYNDPLTARLISLGDQKPLGKIPNYEGDWCWIRFARFLTPKSEVQKVIDVKLNPVKETQIDNVDIQIFKQFIDKALTTTSQYLIDVEDALKACQICKKEASHYNKVNEFINELLKCDE